ncbi:10185_t:CDS:2, partial [Gigaspora rosea]
LPLHSDNDDININLCSLFSNHKDYNTIVNTDDEDNDINNININLCSSSSNHKDYDTILNTNLPPLEYNHNFLLLSEYDDDFNTSISLPFENESNVSGSSYQYNLHIFCHDKDLENSMISRCKSFRCLSSGIYAPKKVIDQNSHRIRGTIKMNCEWHCNFIFPKTAHRIST